MNTKEHTSEYLITDDQLVLFIDALRDGKTFQEACVLVGVSARDEKKISALRDFSVFESVLKQEKEGIVPSIALTQNILEVIPLISPASPSFPVSPVGDGSIKSPYGNTLDWLVESAAHPSWKVAAPVMVMFLVFSALLNLNLRARSGASVSAPSFSPQVEAPLAMNTAEQHQGGVVTQSVTLSAPQNNKMSIKSASDAVSPAVSSPDTADDILALVLAEAGADEGDEGVDQYASLMAPDPQSADDLEQAYDETAI